MRTELISRNDIEEVQAALNCSVKTALDHIAPWASSFARVQDEAGKIGYIAFESVADFEVWKKQK